MSDEKHTDEIEVPKGFEIHQGALCDEKVAEQRRRDWREECQESRELNS